MKAWGAALLKERLTLSLFLRLYTGYATSELLWPQILA